VLVGSQILGVLIRTNMLGVPVGGSGLWRDSRFNGTSSVSFNEVKPGWAGDLVVVGSTGKNSSPSRGVVSTFSIGGAFMAARELQTSNVSKLNALDVSATGRTFLSGPDVTGGTWIGNGPNPFTLTQARYNTGSGFDVTS